MKIIRVLNTNAVVTLDNDKKEVIFTGSGIGFKKKNGEELAEELIDKTYRLQSNEDSHRLQQIVESISEQYLDIVGKIISTAKDEYNLKINDVLYITLMDHINSAVERYKSGIILKNMMKIDIQKFYIKEYTIGKKAIQWILEETGIDLGDDEAAFIAMHVITSELDNSEMIDIEKITEMISTILQIVRLHFKIEFHEQSISYQRLITHLKFFSVRIFDNITYQDSMQEIYEVLVTQNSDAYAGVKKVAEFIKKQYSHILTIDEQLYLLIHLKRVLDEN